MTDPDITFNERRSYKQCVLHGRCPVYGDPFSDESRRVLFVGKVSAFLKANLQQYPIDTMVGLPECMAVLICWVSARFCAGFDLAPAASLSRPTDEYTGLKKDIKWSGAKKLDTVVVPLVLCTSLLCMVLQASKSRRQDEDNQVKLETGRTSANSDDLSGFNMNVRKKKQIAMHTTDSTFASEIQLAKYPANQKSEYNGLFSKFAIRAMLRNSETLNGNWDIWSGNLFRNEGSGIRNHTGFHLLRFVMIVLTINAFAEVQFKEAPQNVFGALTANSFTFPDKSKPYWQTSPSSDYCLGNEVMVQWNSKTYCALDGFQESMPIGASADKFAFYVVAIVFLLAGPVVQIAWRFCSALVGFPRFGELSIITVDTKLSPSEEVNRGENGLARVLRSAFEFMSLVYDPSATPLREQSYDDLYVKQDVQDPVAASKLYASLHADVAVREDPGRSAPYTWLYTPEMQNIVNIAIHDGVIVGFSENPGRLWKFANIMLPNSYIDVRRGEYDSSLERLRSLIGNSIIKIVFYKDNDPKRVINFAVHAFQANSAGRYAREQEFKSVMIGYKGNDPDHAYNGVAFQTQKPVYRHPNGTPDTFFPWTTVKTHPDTSIATYRARVTNVVAIVCFRLFMAIACFVSAGFAELPWPFSGLYLRTKDCKMPSTPDANDVNVCTQRVVELDVDVLAARSRAAGTFEYTVKSPKAPSYSKTGYNGVLTTSPALMLLYIGFYFTFQTLWLIASTVLHRLVIMELGYLRLMASKDPVEIQENIKQGEPSKYWCRFTKYGARARRKRIKDLTPAYLILGICVVGIIVSATSKDPAWLEMTIAGVAIAVTALYLVLNLMVFKDTLSLKTRKAIYTERGTNEEIEEMSREGEAEAIADAEDQDEARNVGLHSRLVF